MGNWLPFYPADQLPPNGQPKRIALLGQIWWRSAIQRGRSASSPMPAHIAARRALGEGKRYSRVNQFIAPFWALAPPQSEFPELCGHAWVPMNDEHSLYLTFSYAPAEPLYPRTRELLSESHIWRRFISTAPPALSG